MVVPREERERERERARKNRGKERGEEDKQWVEKEPRWKKAFMPVSEDGSVA